MQTKGESIPSWIDSDEYDTINMFLLDLQNMLWKVSQGDHPDLVEMDFVLERWAMDGEDYEGELGTVPETDD